jgi:hypothetical protein
VGSIGLDVFLLILGAIAGALEETVTAIKSMIALGFEEDSEATTVFNDESRFFSTIVDKDEVPSLFEDTCITAGAFVLELSSEPESLGLGSKFSGYFKPNIKAGMT